MNLTKANFDNVMNKKIKCKMMDGTKNYRYCFFDKNMSKDISNVIYCYGFNLINENSGNSKYVANYDLFLRLAYGTDKNLQVNCNILNEFSTENSFNYESALITLVVSDFGNYYRIRGFLKVKETFVQYAVYPYVNTDYQNCFLNSKVKYTEDEYTTIISSALSVIDFKNSKRVTYGDTKHVGSQRISSNLKVDGTAEIVGDVTNHLRVPNHNIYTNNIVIGGNGITPKVDGTEQPLANIKYNGTTGWVIGGNFIPRNDSSKLGNENNKWSETNTKVIKADYYNIKSPNGTVFQIKVRDDGTLYAYNTKA